MKFEYAITLKEGFKPVMELELETDVKIVIEAKNRVTSDRMIKAMLKGATNIEDITGICVDR